MIHNNTLQYCPNPACGALLQVSKIVPAGRCWKCGRKLVIGSDMKLRGETGSVPKEPNVPVSELNTQTAQTA